MKRLLILILIWFFCSGMGACGMGFGSFVSSAGENTGQTPLHRLNHSNHSDRQECIDRNGHWIKAPKLVKNGKTYYGWECQPK